MDNTNLSPQPTDSTPVIATQSNPTLIETKPTGAKSFLPFVIIAGIGILLLLVVATFAFSRKDNKTDDDIIPTPTPTITTTTVPTTTVEVTPSTTTSVTPTPVNTITNITVEFEGENITYTPTKYLSFKTCANNLCKHYLLNNTQLSKHPIISTVDPGVSFVISGTYENLNTTSGNQFIELKENISISLIAMYEGNFSSLGDGKEYVSFVVTNPTATYTKHYLLDKTKVSLFGSLDGAKLDDKYKISGNTASKGIMETNQYYELTSNRVIEKYK